jgi:hypothetical protein
MVSVAHIVGKAAIAPAMVGPANRLLSTAAATMTIAPRLVRAVVDQCRAAPRRISPAGVSRGATASAPTATRTAMAAGTCVMSNEQAR